MRSMAEFNSRDYPILSINRHLCAKLIPILPYASEPALCFIIPTPNTDRLVSNTLRTSTNSTGPARLSVWLLPVRLCASRSDPAALMCARAGGTLGRWCRVCRPAAPPSSPAVLSCTGATAGACCRQGGRQSWWRAWYTL